MKRMADQAQPDTDARPGTIAVLERLLEFADAGGDISPLIAVDQLARLGQEVCDNYERDLRSRSVWQTVAEKALKDIAKTDGTRKDYPWAGASNVHYPLLAFAAMQFNARAYPAIVKGDEAVSCKVVGADKGQPHIGQDGQPVMQVQGMPVAMTPQGPAVMTPQGMVPLPEGMQPEPVWKRPPGAKVKRSLRVRDYMNTVLFYRMDDWEGETDALLFQLAAIGVEFRKVWCDGEKHNSVFVPALNLVVHNDAKSLKDAPQITERMDGVYPHQIKRDVATGKYRAGLVLVEDDREPRLVLEQQCHYDMDGDGIPEPYIVTLDHKDRFVLRVVPDFDASSVKVVDGRVAYISRRTFYVKYEFLPEPEGKFYNIGLAHLLDQYGEVVDTIINQMIDANHAATAGGGFVASGLRIQGQGQASSLKFRPGEYKTVGVTGSALKDGLVERTYPQLSPVMFQLLELILGAAKDIASIKDVLSGDASNNGQVGTTLALIEQGLQVFTAIYKRVYRGLKAEFALLFDNIGKYADEAAAADYLELLDDPGADIQADFNSKDMDIRPVSDPLSVTRMQRMARAQFLLSTAEQAQAAGVDMREIMRRVYEAADMEDIDKLMPEKQPDPMAEITMKGAVAEIDKTVSEAERNRAEAKKAESDAAVKAETATVDAYRAGFSVAA
jgi:chaperonin GroES